MARGTGITGELDLADDEPPPLPAPDAVVISTDRLTKTYGSRAAVHELSIAVQQGEVYGLLGPNGAGKTTTLRMLLGLVRPTSGSATVCEARPGSSASLAAVGSLVEEPALYPYLSGRDNLRVLARYSAVHTSRVDEVLDRVALLPRAGDKVRTYSLGMRQRLGVAAALLKDPAVLILDEPTNGLDPQGMAQMRRLIRELGTGDRTVVLSSHLLSEVEQVCDRVGVIREGILIAQGPVSQLRGAEALHIVADQPDHARDVLLRERDVVEAVEVDGDRLVVTAPADAAAHLNAVLVEQGVAVSHLTMHQRSLEDVFLDMTGEEARPGAAAGGRDSDATP
ncbi:MAG TPA: ABC transporter ATP-binding protein [Euzebyales bacterium]|nr:ABC transporter ATP-binding protein [Euzebyales bacterium]